MMTLHANWLRHMQYNASPSMRMLVRIYYSVGVWSSFVDGPCDQMPSYPVSVVSVTPTSRSMDPIMRTSECSSCDVVLELNDGVKNRMVTAPLYMSMVEILLGAKENAESEFAPYFSGFIDDVVHDDTTVMLRLKSPDINNRKVSSTSAIIAKHPLEAMLTLLAVDSSLVVSASFGKTSIADLGHLVVTRGDIAEWDSAYEISMGESRQSMIDELALMLYGMLRTNENGTLEFVPFEPTNSAAAVWTDDNIADVNPDSLYANMVNVVNVLSHIEDKARSTKGVKSRVRYSVRDATASAIFRNYWSTSADADRSLTVNNDWASAQIQFATIEGQSDKSWTNTVPAATQWVRFFDGSILTGTNSPSFPSQLPSAGTELANSRLMYMQFESEIVSFDRIEFVALGPGLDPSSVQLSYFDVNSPDWETTVSRPLLIRARIAERGALGTTPAAHLFNENNSRFKFPMYDITIPVWTAQRLIDRFAYGAPVVTLTTSIAEMALQIGDLIEIHTDRIKWYLNDGSDANHRWEIIGKRVIPHDDTPRIEWTVCLAADDGRAASTLTRTVFGVPFVSANDRLRLTRGQLSTVQKFVQSGFGQSISGLNVTIGKGVVVTSTGAREMTTDVQLALPALAATLVSVDGERGSLFIRPMSPETDFTDLGESEVPLWKFTTDVSGVIKKVDLRPSAAATGVQIDKQTLGTAAFDPNYVGAQIIQNPNFSVFTRDRDLYPPDSWTPIRDALSTEPEGCKEPTPIQTLTQTATVASNTTVLTLSTAPGVDDALYLAFVSDSITILSISQTNVTWTQVGGNLSHGSVSQVSSVWRGNPTGTGGVLVTVTFSANGVGDPIILTVWSNVSTVTPDATATATGTSTTVDTGNITSTRGRVLMLGFAAREDTTGDAFSDYGQGWVEAATIDGASSPAGTAHALSMFVRVENGGTYDFKATVGASDEWNAHALIIPADTWGFPIGFYPFADGEAGGWGEDDVWYDASFSVSGDLTLRCRLGLGEDLLGAISDMTPVIGSELYVASIYYSGIWDYGDTPGGGDAFTGRSYVIWYDANRLPISSSIVNNQSHAVDTGGTSVSSFRDQKYIRAPNTAAFCRMIVMGDTFPSETGIVLSVWFDYAKMERVGAAAQVYRASSTQSINSGSTTKVQFNAETFDYGGDFDASTNFHFDVRDTARYSMSAVVTLGALPTGKYARIDIYKNNALEQLGQASWNGSGSDQDVTIAVYLANMRLAAGDYIDIRLTHDAGSAKNVQIGADKTRFAIEQITLDSE